MIELFTGLIFAIGALLALIFLLTLRRRHNRLAPIFSLMVLALAIYVIGYGFELTSTTIDQIELFLRLEYFGASFMSALWFLVAYKIRTNKLPPFYWIYALMAIPAMTLVISSTTAQHGWLYASIDGIWHDGHLIADLTPGPWYIVHVGYSYAMIIGGIILTYLYWRKARTVLKRQAFWLMLAASLLIVLNSIYIARLLPVSVDLAPVGMGFFVFAFFLSFARYDFLGVRDVGRETAFDESHDGVLIVDERGRLIDFNPTACQTFTWLDPTALGVLLSEWPDGQAILSRQEGRFEMQIHTDDGLRALEFRVVPLARPREKIGVIYFFSDITIQRRLIDELDFMASYDALTHIYNRRRLLEEAARELKRIQRYGGSLAVLMIDIDHFKRINDRYGHAFGDEVIRAITRACGNRLRSTDIFGRYGGEEFVVVLGQADREQAVVTAETIREIISGLVVPAPGPDLGQPVTMTISIGVAVLTPDADAQSDDLQIEAMINQADIALYAAKDAGRNCVRVYSSHKVGAAANLTEASSSERL
jgi:diguanylate cyclase (GGDEF)-like protein